MNVPTECPACKEDLRYRDRDSNGEEQEYSRVIGIYDRDKDLTTHWRCPDCNHEWRRE